MSLVRHGPSWEAARSEYPIIDRPVLLLYGDHDWSRPDERQANQRDIPGAQLRVVANAGHFLTLDAPVDLIRSVREFAERPRSATQIRGDGAKLTSVPADPV